jgi:ABC-type uncharacterized transport system involved in gliding motility auxiliary subunit
MSDITTKKPNINTSKATILKTLSNSLFFVLLALIFFAAVLITNGFLKGFSADLTEQKVYSLSAGSEAILADLDEPINLYFFFSDETSTGMTAVRDYADRVRSLLSEYEEKSQGKVTLKMIDPAPFSEAEDRAASFGLTAAATGFAQDSVYFGLVGTNALDDSMIIGFFDPQKESFLEYDISNMLYQLSQPEPVKLTLLTDLQIAGGQNPLTGQSVPANVMYQQLQDFFDITLLSASDFQLPDDTELLMILHPQNVNDDLLRSIDQYLLQDGKALVFMDPHYESDQMAQMGSVGANSSALPLLAHYGIQVSTQNVVLDAQTGLEVRSGDGQIIRHLGFLGLGQTQINRDDITSADLDTFNGASFGSLALTNDASLTQTVLISSSVNSATIAAAEYAGISDPSEFNARFASQDKEQVLAARYSGSATSYFAQLDVSQPEVAESDITDSGFVGEETIQPLLVSETDNLNIVVIADVDFTADRFWVQQSNFFGQTVFSPFANNGDFVTNLLENLGGSEGLIGIRSRGTFARPFTLVQEIQVDAEQRFREQEQRLQQQLEQTETQLAELQTQSDSLTLSTEQQATIDAFTAQRINIRKSLRDVQFQLDKDIDELGNWLKLVNIAGTPLLLVLILFLLSKAMRKKAPKVTV